MGAVPPIRLRSMVRGVLVPSAVAGTVTVVAAGLWVLIAGGSVVGRLGATAVTVGALVMVTWGSVFWQVTGGQDRAARRGETDGFATPDLTGLGLPLFVGVSLMLIGAVLLSV